ncbi:hypothetical protein NU688_05145 [Variovorax sp. ZS18.2.2]|uniref:hypothetical protein n=1 Tax=Variovorax sp. ZS18.2.2 TaxID=2971255 RepID=UPI0021508B9D|nr:hypothetical protein [Variovorax sp. ZS18.2.2]MCR6475534.1 hypothetical protein [Variovorax sp. ZS18.2.2]
MKKILFVLAACVISSAALAQPMSPNRGPGYDRSHAGQNHRKHKVWVPAHREHGRRVPGHYVWR